MKYTEEFDNLFNEFKKLGLDAKRNAYSEEIIKLALLLKAHLNKINLDLIDIPYNYRSLIDKDMKETDLLDINFKDIYILKVELLLLLNYYEKTNRGEL